MTFSDSFSDRHILSTDTNEYSGSLYDETAWAENLVDYEVYSDDEIPD